MKRVFVAVVCVVLFLLGSVTQAAQIEDSWEWILDDERSEVRELENRAELVFNLVPSSKEGFPRFEAQRELMSIKRNLEIGCVEVNDLTMVNFGDSAAFVLRASQQFSKQCLLVLQGLGIEIAGGLELTAEILRNLDTFTLVATNRVSPRTYWVYFKDEPVGIWHGILPDRLSDGTVHDCIKRGISAISGYTGHTGISIFEPTLNANARFVRRYDIQQPGVKVPNLCQDGNLSRQDYSPNWIGYYDNGNGAHFIHWIASGNETHIKVVKNNATFVVYERIGFDQYEEIATLSEGSLVNIHRSDRLFVFVTISNGQLVWLRPASYDGLFYTDISSLSLRSDEPGLGLSYVFNFDAPPWWFGHGPTYRQQIVN